MEGSAVFETKERLVVQAERLLEGIQVLGKQYTELSATDEIEAADALSECAVALNRFLVASGEPLQECVGAG